MSEIRDFLPAAIEISKACALAGLHPPALRFSDEDGLKLEQLILSDRLFYDTKFEGEHRGFQLAGISFHWNARRVAIKRWQKTAETAMAEFANEQR